MAKRVVDPAVFARHYPPETAQKCYEAALVIQRECEITTQIRTHRESMSSGTSTTSSSLEDGMGMAPRVFNGMMQPPSWADVGLEEQRPVFQHGQYQYHHQNRPMYQTPYQQQPVIHHQEYQQFQPRHDQNFMMQQQQQAAPDVFSSMGHWQCEKPRTGRYNYGQYQQGRHQYQGFAQAPSKHGQDVFQDVGVWDNSLPQQPTKPTKIVPMPVDPYAPTPPPTFQPYPPMSSPSTSFMSFDEPEEKNSWKSFDLLLNQKPSTSSNLH